MHQTALQRGFTLVELVMVIVIMGVIGGMVSVFMKSPIDAYFASARRAAMTDVADTTVRRMARDMRKALPNSIRTPTSAGVGQCIEFIPTRTGARYRGDAGATGDDDILDFVPQGPPDPGDTSFDMFGLNSALPPDQQIVPGDVIAVYNLGPGINDAYVGNNTSVVSVVGAGNNPANETKITIGGKRFPLASGSNRFHVVPKDENVVAYVCDSTAHELRRTASTTFTSACPKTGALVAGNVSSCNFVYNGSDLQRNAMVQLSIRFTDGSGETVSLYHEVHVDNTP